MVTNGNFATDSDWSKGAGWGISGGAANSITSGGSSYIAQSATEVGLIYFLDYSVLNYVSGTVKFLEGASRTANGGYPETFTAAGSNVQFKSQSGTFAGSIDNVSVKRKIEVAS